MTDFDLLLESIDREVRSFAIKEIELSPENKLAGERIAGGILKKERAVDEYSIEEQSLLFRLLYDLANDKEIGGVVSVARQVLIVWSDRTINRFGEVYRLGWDNGHRAGSFFTQKRLKKSGEKKIRYRVSKAANALHDKPGGSRSKANAIREIWASGKYSSRDLCAQEECDHLGMSLSAARKALRNTPAPPLPQIKAVRNIHLAAFFFGKSTIYRAKTYKDRY